MLYNLFFTLMLLFSSGYSMDMTSCRKIGEMNNNINGQPLYSTGLYMCLELPNQKIETKKPNLLDYPTQDNSDDNQFLSNSSISNSQNSTNSTIDMKTLYNSSTVIKNLTNTSTTLLPTTPISVPTTPSSTTTPSPTTTSLPTTTPSPTTTSLPTTPSPTTPSPTTVLPTTPSPTTNKPPDPTTSSPTPSPITRQDLINPTKNQLPNITNTQNEQLDNKKQDLNISLENNPLLPIVITLSSVILLVFCGACCNWLYNKRKIKKISCNKSDKNQEPDIESGEKKNRNSWTFSHTNMAQKKLRAMEQFKKAGNRGTKKKALKPKLEKRANEQKSTPNRKPPNPKVAAAALRGLNNKQKKDVKNTLLEQAKNIPNGKNNPTLQKMLNRLEPHEETDDATKWYQEEFQAELDHLDIMKNRPLTPPPPLPVPTFNQQSQPPVRKVYGNPNNKKSPKMTINEINPESPIRN